MQEKHNKLKRKTKKTKNEKLSESFLSKLRDKGKHLQDSDVMRNKRDR